jgi:hypothetical protein
MCAQNTKKIIFVFILLVFKLRVLVYFGRLQTQMGMTNATNGTLYVEFGAEISECR